MYPNPSSMYLNVTLFWPKNSKYWGRRKLKSVFFFFLLFCLAFTSHFSAFTIQQVQMDTIILLFFLYIHVCRKKDCNLPGTHFFNSIIQSPKGNFLVFWSPWFFNLKPKLQQWNWLNPTLNFNPKNLSFLPNFFLVVMVVTIECREYMLLNDVTLSYTYTKLPKSKQM